MTEICTRHYGVFVKTSTDPELFYIGASNEGGTGRGDNGSASNPVRVLASSDAVVNQGPFMKASDVIFPNTHHAPYHMLFGFGYQIGGDVVVPTMRVSSFDARISTTGVDFSAEMQPGTNTTTYYVFATVRNDLSDAQAKAIALSGAEGVLRATLETSLTLENAMIQKVFDANQSLTDAKNVHFARVYLYLKESQGNEQLKSKDLILNATPIFANVNRVEFVPFVNRVEVDTGSFSTSVTVTKFTSALFVPKLLDTLTDTEVVAMIAAAKDTAAVQVVESGSVQVGLFGSASVHFTSYLEADGSVVVTSDGPRYEAATVVENADGSQSVLARMRPIIGNITYYLDSVMDVNWSTKTAGGVKTSNYHATDIQFTEKYCVMCHSTTHIELFDRESDSTNVAEGYQDLYFTTNFSGADICFSQHEMMLMDFGRNKLYIIELDDIVSHLLPNNTGGVQFDLSQHTSKPYFEFDFDVGSAPYSTYDWINHRCESKIDNNFAAFLGMVDRMYMIYIFKRDLPTENHSGWSFFQALNTNFTPSTNNWTSYRLSVKGDTIFLQPGNMVSTYTTGWYMIYTFVEDKFVYTDTVNFMVRDIASSYLHGVKNYAMNPSIYSDKYAVWYAMTRDNSVNCYIARKRSSLPATIDY